MNLASVRLVTNNVDGLASFYSVLTGVQATRPSPEFAEFRFSGAALAISSERLVKQFNAGAAVAAANRSAMIEFQVDDVDAVRSRLGDATIDYAMPPTDMPWGNRSMLLRDPDGNVVNVFARMKRAA
ncbi:MAG: VOC family protein [Bauldia sp.]